MDGAHHGAAGVDGVAHRPHHDGRGAGVQPRRRLVHEHDAGVGDELDGNGEPLALLHAEAELAGQADDGVTQRLQLHQGHHLSVREVAVIQLVTVIQLVVNQFAVVFPPRHSPH